MKKKRLFPVWHEIDVDLETPVSAFLKLKKLGAQFLLESVEKGEQIGRYSFIGLKPTACLKIEKEKLSLDDKVIPISKDNFVPKLRELLFAYELRPEPGLPPFIGGWIGYLGYDLVRFFESIPDACPSAIDLPEGILYLVKDVLVFDHLKHRAKVVSLCSSNLEAEKKSQEKEKLIQQLQLPWEESRLSTQGQPGPHEPVANFGKKEFEGVVRKAKEYILAGDIFQVVLSHRYAGITSTSPFDVYRKLRMINPSPYMFYLDFQDFRLIGSSPEALVTLKNRKANLCPIAGTRPRGRTLEEDQSLEKELFQSEKEKAEHVMLVDLARNDLGKVCLPHSIKLHEVMSLERYSHVMHLVSKVEGTLNDRFDALDLFQAAFPAGTVTGAPKIRAMEIIDELEKIRRGPYSGAVGYFGLDGNMDLCIAIRMIVHQGDRYYLQAGAGIVADSLPEFEYKETLNKMEGLYQAVKQAEEGR